MDETLAFCTGRTLDLYDERGQGAPEDWCTEQAQGEPKIMVFHAISGHGLVFGPYPIRNRPYNSAEYIR